MTVRRRPRFDRVASTAIRLTSDDIAVIRALGKLRFLRSTHITRLLFHRQPKKVIERLALLYHAGFIDRPRAQINYHAQSGSAPIVYALGNRGAEVFAEIEHAPAPVTDWTDKNRTAKRPYIEHALLLANLMLPLEITAADNPDIAFVGAEALRQSLPPTARGCANPWTLTARIRDGGRHHDIAATPDAVFALQFPAFGRRSFFFVESDRATMPIIRSDLSQTSFRRKLLAYLAAHKERQHVERLGFPNLRVLTITTSAERTASMLNVVRDITGGRGSGMFLFVGAIDLAAARSPFDIEWMATTGITRIDARPRTGAPACPTLPVP